MGIQGLLPALGSITQKVHISAYSGKTIAVDGHCWLHRSLISESYRLGIGEKISNNYVRAFMHWVNLLKHHNVTPIVVFDGQPLPLKSVTNEARRISREEATERGLVYHQRQDHKKAEAEFKKAISIKPAMINAVIQELDKVNIMHIVAPYEADSQIAYLCQTKQVSAVISEDSDLLVFGCQEVIYKMDRYGCGASIRYRDIFKPENKTDYANFTLSMFQNAAVLGGCDYLLSIKGKGRIAAISSIRHGLSEEEIHQQASSFAMSPETYQKSIRKALNAFRYQFVFDPRAHKYTRLNDLPNSINESELDYLGINPQNCIIPLLKSNKAHLTAHPIGIDGKPYISTLVNSKTKQSITKLIEYEENRIAEMNRENEQENGEENKENTLFYDPMKLRLPHGFELYPDGHYYHRHSGSRSIKELFFNLPSNILKRKHAATTKLCRDKSLLESNASFTNLSFSTSSSNSSSNSNVNTPSLNQQSVNASSGSSQQEDNVNSPLDTHQQTVNNFSFSIEHQSVNTQNDETFDTTTQLSISKKRLFEEYIDVEFSHADVIIEKAPTPMTDQEKEAKLAAVAEILGSTELPHPSISRFQDRLGGITCFDINRFISSRTSNYPIQIKRTLKSYENSMRARDCPKGTSYVDAYQKEEAKRKKLNASSKPTTQDTLKDSHVIPDNPIISKELMTSNSIAIVAKLKSPWQNSIDSLFQRLKPRPGRKTKAELMASPLFVVVARLQYNFDKKNCPDIAIFKTELDQTTAEEINAYIIDIKDSVDEYVYRYLKMYEIAKRRHGGLSLTHGRPRQKKGITATTLANLY